MNSRLPQENSDTVNLVCALLVRFPEIASVRSMPADGTVRFTFVVGQRVDREGQRAAVASIHEHVDGFLHLREEPARVVQVECETDRAVTFLHVTRDLQTISRDELVMLVEVFSDRFREKLVRNPVPEDHLDDDPIAQEEMVDYALDSIRQSKTLVGFREEKRVLVYFLKSRKKAKATGRS